MFEPMPLPSLRFPFMLATAILLDLTHTCFPAQTPANSTDRPSFEVASVKMNDPSKNVGVSALWAPSPARLEAIGSLKTFIKQAYGVEDVQISGGPNWIDGSLFKIDAKASSAVSEDKLRLMLQTLLAERFKLTIHTETRQLTLYSLVPAKNGSKLQQAGHSGGLTTGRTFLRGTTDVANLASALTTVLGRPVVDNTGLNGPYEIALTWSLEGATFFAGAPPVFADFPRFSRSSCLILLCNGPHLEHGAGDLATPMSGTRDHDRACLHGRRVRVSRGRAAVYG